MNDWLHCNKCSTKFQPPMKLFLSECGHIFCEKCGENIKSKCLICDKTSNFIPISKDMDISVQQFFIPLDLQIKKLSEVYNFQMQHRMRMFQTLAQKYAFAKKECINVHNKNKNLLRENRTLKNMLMSATRNNNLPFLTSTPALTNDTSQMDDMSVVSSIPPFTPSVSSRPGHLQRIQNNDSNIRASHYPPVSTYNN
ncbi:nenya isoform X2 [Leptinotarsa decemlineata]|uniref:nenya isoform X2 n=1 Tax=Leptinotarsa decemlineata TaxID=7539 RepID=UPI000C25360C|nr:probable E3 SUMO-protein ligase RNF212 isoform X2 [Leptinotarsa decemlineata]